MALLSLRLREARRAQAPEVGSLSRSFSLAEQTCAGAVREVGRCGSSGWTVRIASQASLPSSTANESHELYQGGRTTQ